MPWDVKTQTYFVCVYCLGKSDPPSCDCDLQRTTGGCWTGEHDRCKGKCSSSEYGLVDCACRCHRASQAEIDAAIASIKEVWR